MDGHAVQWLLLQGQNTLISAGLTGTGGTQIGNIRRNEDQLWFSSECGLLERVGDRPCSSKCFRVKKPLNRRRQDTMWKQGSGRQPYLMCAWIFVAASASSFFIFSTCFLARKPRISAWIFVAARSSGESDWITYPPTEWRLQRNGKHSEDHIEQLNGNGRCLLEICWGLLDNVLPQAKIALTTNIGNKKRSKYYQADDEVFFDWSQSIAIPHEAQNSAYFRLLGEKSETKSSLTCCTNSFLRSDLSPQQKLLVVWSRNTYWFLLCDTGH